MIRKTIVTALLLFLLLVNLKAAAYMGAARCAECHEKEYAIWLRGRHARATKVLKGGALKNPTCVSCHTTDGLELGENFRFAGVQCESCHGAGDHYGFTDVMRNKSFAIAKGLVPQSREVCIRCHMSVTSPTTGEFDYTEALKLIRHWN